MASTPPYQPFSTPVIESGNRIMTQPWQGWVRAITTQASAAGPGDVVGPASSTDNAIARFDGTTGKLLQNSGITIADGATGTLSGSNSGDVTLAGENYLSLAAQVITANAVNLAGTNVTGTLPVTKGGTGQTSYTNGQLLIGNTTGNTLTKATLTAGSNITITNGNGSIEIASTAVSADYVVLGNGVQPPTPVDDGAGSFIYVGYAP